MWSRGCWCGDRCEGDAGARSLRAGGGPRRRSGAVCSCVQLMNINSLPMVVDMTGAARIGTYTGLYYLFSTLSAIVGPNSNGWIIQLTGRNYNAIMIVAPVFMAVALALM